MKYLLTVAIIMWGVFFYTNARAHETDQEKYEIQMIQEQINEMTLEIISIILENLPAILESIEKDLLKKLEGIEKKKPCWHIYPKDPDCIPKMEPMAGEVKKSD